MGELLAFSESRLLLSSPSRLQFPSRTLRHHIHRSQSSLAIPSPTCLVPTKLGISGSKFTYQRHRSSPNVRTNVVSDSTKPTTFTVGPPSEEPVVLPDSGGSGDIFGGGGNGGEGGGGKGEDGGDENEDVKKKGMSTSQKITLGYAALVGIGGLMGFLKGGSSKSLVAGGGFGCFVGHCLSVITVEAHLSFLSWSRAVCFSSWSHGLSVQEVGEGISSWRRLIGFLDHEFWLCAWDFP